MKILSLFDGVSCARLAIEKNGIPIEAYYASEIDKYAIKVTQANRPNTIQLGSVSGIKVWQNELDVSENRILFLPAFKAEIDLLIGGSPCQDLSIAKKDRKGLDGERSSLFWEYVRILNEVKPKYFILENVASMPQKDKDIISQTLGVQPVMINASLVSAQNRKRLFWVGKFSEYGGYEQVYVPQPEDKGILLKDILEQEVGEQYNVGANFKFGNSQGNKVYNSNGKSRTLMALGGGGGAKTGLYAVALTKGRTEEGKRMRKEMQEKTGKDWGSWKPEYTQYVPREDGKSNTLTTGLTKEGFIQADTQIRKLTPAECERLQCMPDNWTNPTGDISNSQRYKMCGNAFNVDVVAHIIKFLK